MPKYFIKFIEHFEHNGDVEYCIEEYAVSREFKNIIEKAVNSKQQLYIEATPEQCQQLKFENLDWDFDNNCLVTKDMDALLNEAVSKQCRITSTNSEIKVLIPINEQIDINAEDLKDLPDNTERLKFKQAFKDILNDDDIRLHFSKYISELIKAHINNAKLISKDDLNKIGE